MVFVVLFDLLAIFGGGGAGGTDDVVGVASGQNGCCNHLYNQPFRCGGF